MHDKSPVCCSFAKDPGNSFQALGLGVFGGSRFRHLAFFGLRCDFGLLSCRTVMLSGYCTSSDGACGTAVTN